MNPEIATEKEALRLQARKVRAIQLSHLYDATISVKAAAHAVAALADLPKGAVIGCYWPLGDELDTRPLMRDLSRAGYICALPVAGCRSQPLTFRPWDIGDPLIEGPHGTRQPDESAPDVTPDALLLPLLAFDENGNRLGWGGGYYDRTLAFFSEAQAFGFAYAGQMVDHVPHDRHDVPLKVIITETGIVHCPPVKID